jgi:hypothetical protein
MAHPPFDLEAEIARYPLDAHLRQNGTFGGFSIASPKNAALTEQLRRRLNLYDECAVVGETDVLVPVPAEDAECLGSSRYGGVPMMEDEDPWPTATKTGEPMKFVAQISLVDSFDLLGPVPGDLVLVFCHAVREQGETEWCAVEFEADWSSSRAPLRTKFSSDDVLWLAPFATFQLWRAAQFDYSDVLRLRKTYERDPTARLARLGSRASPHALGPLQGFRIGGQHHSIQHPADVGEFLSEFDSIWLEDEQYRRAGINSRVIGFSEFDIAGDGQLYVGMRQDRQLVCELQCY